MSYLAPVEKDQNSRRSYRADQLQMTQKPTVGVDGAYGAPVTQTAATDSVQLTQTDTKSASKF